MSTDLTPATGFAEALEATPARRRLLDNASRLPGEPSALDLLDYDVLRRSERIEDFYADARRMRSEAVRTWIGAIRRALARPFTSSSPASDGRLANASQSLS